MRSTTLECGHRHSERDEEDEEDLLGVGLRQRGGVDVRGGHLQQVAEQPPVMQRLAEGMRDAVGLVERVLPERVPGDGLAEPRQQRGDDLLHPGVEHVLAAHESRVDEAQSKDEPEDGQ
jgi:hypothetical protein